MTRSSNCAQRLASALRPRTWLAELSDGSRVPHCASVSSCHQSPREVNSEYAANVRDLARRLELLSDYVGGIQ